MELFSKLFGSWLVFVNHCFDRMVLMGLQRPRQVVYWLQHVLGIEAITKEVLSSRTQDCVRGVEAFAPNQRLPLEWAEKERAQRGLCGALLAAHGTRRSLWGVLPLPNHGTGLDFSSWAATCETGWTGCRLSHPA
jgi:hypothetical protein